MLSRTIVKYMLNIAVFGSGRGSNFRAILTAIEQGSVPQVKVCCVLSNNSDAGILEIARAHAIPAIHLSQKQFASEEEFVDSLLAVLRSHEVNFIVLAGYMKRLSPRVIAAYRNSIINIHPALLPKFGGAGMYGMHVHEAVIAAHEEFSGATVHFVDEEYDHGAVVMQHRIAVAPDDTPASLATRVLAVEHELYPKALRRIALDRAQASAADVHHL